MKEVDFKMKTFEKAQNELSSQLAKEFDVLKPADFEDYHKNHIIIKKVRKFKNTLSDYANKLKDLEDIQKRVVKVLTEQDMENSIDLLAGKAHELRERLELAKGQLKRIMKSGEEMDGNVSNNEEEEFILALKNEMPEVFENIETTLTMLKDIDKLIFDVKSSLSVEKMTDLKEKVDIASENVEETESLVQKLEKEIIEWNAQKKLCRRDAEIEEIANLTSEFIEHLNHEKNNTIMEMEKN